MIKRCLKGDKLVVTNSYCGFIVGYIQGQIPVSSILHGKVFFKVEDPFMSGPLTEASF